MLHFRNFNFGFPENNTLIVKLEKKGTLYMASCSSDGRNFKAIGNLK